MLTLTITMWYFLIFLLIIGYFLYYKWLQFKMYNIIYEFNFKNNLYRYYIEYKYSEHIFNLKMTLEIDFSYGNRVENKFFINFYNVYKLKKFIKEIKNDEQLTFLLCSKYKEIDKIMKDKLIYKASKKYFRINKIKKVL